MSANIMIWMSVTVGGMSWSGFSRWRPTQRRNKGSASTKTNSAPGSATMAWRRVAWWMSDLIRSWSSAALSREETASSPKVMPNVAMLTYADSRNARP